jgi:LPS-assembly protein
MRSALGVVFAPVAAVALGSILTTLATLPAAAQQRPADQLQNVLKSEPGRDLLDPGRAFPRKNADGTSRTKGPARPPKDQSQPLYLEGDQLVYDTRGNRVIARGNVQIFYNNYSLTANEVIYDQNANTLIASGNVTIKEPNGNIVRAENANLTDDFRDAFVQSLSITASDDTKIGAERAIRRDNNVTEFVNARFTPCKTTNDVPPLWCISGARVTHDQGQGTITYQDARFELFGVPILYLPYFQHPDPSTKRKSGFLLPEYGNSSTLGFMVETPYFWNLAPNYDVTFHPMYTSRQGILYQADWRHRLVLGQVTGQYSLKLAGIDQNDSSYVSDDLHGKFRGSVETRGIFNLSSWWTAGWDITAETDDSFRRFYKLDNLLQTDRVNTIFLNGLSDRNYLGIRAYQFGGLLFNDTPSAEARVAPIVDYNYIFNKPVLGGELSADLNAMSFARSDAIDNVRRTDINRVTSEVKWRRTLTDAVGITYTPFAALRGDAYQFNNYLDPATGQAVSDDTVTRGIGTAAATVSYPWVAAGANGSHVIEPIGQIVARQASATSQRGLPDEDAKSLYFDGSNLFEVDKFSGRDRYQTGTRANVGLQYTFQLNTGGYAALLAGQSFHLSGDNAYRDPGRDIDGNFVFNPASGLETTRSDYVLGMTLAPSSAFRVVSQTRFDERDMTLRREDAFVRFAYGPLAAQAAYSYAAADPMLGIDKSQQDIYGSAGLKLTDRWSLLGSVRFDIDAKQRIQDVLQLRYTDECLVMTVSYTETFITDPARDIIPDRSLMLRFELKHLGEFRYKTDVLDHVFGENQPPKP